MARRISEGGKQSDYTNANWKDWAREVSACSQGSGFDHPNCFCGASKQTSEHVAMDCSLMPKRNEIWWTVSNMVKNYRRLMTTFKTTTVLTRWFIKTNLLSMFSLTKNQLYWKIWWWKDLIIKKFDDVKFEILW